MFINALWLTGKVLVELKLMEDKKLEFILRIIVKFHKFKSFCSFLNLNKWNLMLKNNLLIVEEKFLRLKFIYTGGQGIHKEEWHCWDILINNNMSLHRMEDIKEKWCQQHHII